MNTDFIYVGEVLAATRDEVIAWIREMDVDLGRLDHVFLIDRKAKYSRRCVPLRTLVVRGAPTNAWRIS